MALIVVAVVAVGFVIMIPSKLVCESYLVRRTLPYTVRKCRGCLWYRGRCMAEPDAEGNGRRPRLSRERVLQGALSVADTGGLASLTIRSLAEELGVKPMSVYYHVANKDEILAALVDIVFGEIQLPVPGRDWRAEMRTRA